MFSVAVVATAVAAVVVVWVSRGLLQILLP
jgi:hypothetical protein